MQFAGVTRVSRSPQSVGAIYAHAVPYKLLDPCKLMYNLEDISSSLVLMISYSTVVSLHLSMFSSSACMRRLVAPDSESALRKITVCHMLVYTTYTFP